VVETPFDLQRLAAALGGEVSGDQVLAPGPSHSKADRSLAVKIDGTAPDGFLVHSFAKDDALVCKNYVREKCGLPPFKGNGNRRSSSDIANRLHAAVLSQQQEKPKGTLIATYDYRGADGSLLYQVLRYEPKTFRQRRPDKNGFIWKLEDRRVLYRLPELLQYPDATVFVCEGEKDADRLASLRHCATTVASGKWTDECVQALAGRDVLILEDNDGAGRQKAQATATLLHGIAKSVRVVRLPGLPDHGDVSDWLDSSHSSEQLVNVCFDTSLWEPTTATGTPENVCIHDSDDTTPLEQTDRTASIALHWHGDKDKTAKRSWLIEGLLPETGSGLASGQWGTYKTFVALDLAAAVIAGAHQPRPRRLEARWRPLRPRRGCLRNSDPVGRGAPDEILGPDASAVRVDRSMPAAARSG